MRRLLAATMTLALAATVAPTSLADEAASLGQPANTPWSNVQAWETAIVERVVDGDTVIVNDEVTGAQSRVRLLGINAPEKPTTKKPGNCGGEQASQWLTALLPVGTRVRLLSSDRASTGKKKRPQRAVLAYTDDLVLAGGRVPDATFAALKAELSDEAILELTYITCTYEMHATMCRALRLEYDDIDERLVEVPLPEGEARNIDFMRAVDEMDGKD